MCKFESSQKDVSGAQLADFSKAYRKHTALLYIASPEESCFSHQTLLGINSFFDFPKGQVRQKSQETPL